MKSECVSLTCGPTEMSVVFAEGVYLSVEELTPTPSNGTIILNGEEVEGYWVTCELGDCNMTYTMDETT